MKFLTFILFVIDWLLTGWITCYMWNGILPPLLGVTEITFWQGQAVSLFVTWLVTSSHKKKEEESMLEGLLYDLVLTMIFGGMACIYINLGF